MTTIPPARPRPPSILTGVDQGGGLSYGSQPQSVPQAERATPRKEWEDDEVEFVDERPTKRRRLSTGTPSSTANVDAVNTPLLSGHQNGTSSAKYSGATWLAVTSGGPLHPPGGGPSSSRPARALPARPWATQKSRAVLADHNQPKSRIRLDNVVPTTPDSIKTPTAAPLFEDGRRADYFPWTGNHPEDNLTESTVKSGYFDRAPNPLEKELNTAKAPLYNAFKHRAGLESLSALFSLVLSQKSSKGAFSSISSFKGPPPRVTLTELKRKSWISDLANLAVPLKRLSKTIPQGIRGQLLLDQCLQHLVPLSRAIWFVKCVGANEIRTLKRKGVTPAMAQGTEAKWLREWTIHVEQFIDQNLLNCGQSGWKETATYTLNLATQLYAANLLDRDHYLEWMVRSLSASNTNQTPLWLIIVSLYKDDLLAFRKRGKHFVEVLVAKVNSMQTMARELFRPLTDMVCKLFRDSVRKKPACCLMPEQWNECKRALTFGLDDDSGSDQALILRLQTCNERARGRVWQTSASPVLAEERVFEHLDAASAPYATEGLSKTLIEACDDNSALVTACLKWCVSRYRSGSSEIYLVVRLLRSWRKNGVDVDDLFLNFLQTFLNSASVDRRPLRQLVFELSRSHTLSISKYLQWLTVRGTLHASTFSAADQLIYMAPNGQTVNVQSAGDSSQLLTECCLTGQKDHIRNLRNSLLDRSGYDLANELSVVQTCQAYIKQIVSNPGDGHGEHGRLYFSQLPWSVRAELALYTRGLVFNLLGSTPGSNARDAPSAPTLAQLDVVRHIFEQLGDLEMCADVLRALAYCKQEDILAFVTDIVNYYSEEFSAMGALSSLLTTICRRYLSLRPVKTSMRMFNLALIDLCHRYPSKIAPARALQQDLIRGDRSRAIAACSPFSDGVAESLQQAGETFYDDFEAILQTESNMSETTFTQLFGVLSQRIEKNPDEAEKSVQLSRLCHLLRRLKSCRTSPSDSLLKQWLVQRLMNVSSIEETTVVIYYMMANRCISIPVLLGIYQSYTLPETSRQIVQNLTSDAMSELPSKLVNQSTWFAVRLAVRQAAREQPAALLEVLVGAEDRSTGAIDSMLISQVITDVHRIPTFSKAATSALSASLARLLGHVNDPTSGPPSSSQNIRNLLEISDPLAMPYISFRLRMLCEDAAHKADDGMQEHIADVIRRYFREGHGPLVHSSRLVRSLLDAIGPIISTKIRLKMEHEFFDALPKFLHGKSVSHFPLPSTEDSQRAAQALRLICMTSSDKGVPHQAASMTLLVEKLSIYLKCLSSPILTPSVPGTSPSTSSAPAPMQPDTLRAFMLATIDTLEVLMQMVCLKRTVFNPGQSQPSPAVAKQNQQDQIKLVGLVISIATNSAWALLGSGSIASPGHQTKVGNLVDFMFDVAASLVDDMTDESRSFCARLLKDKIKDPRVKWLLGSVKMFGSVQYKDAGAGLELWQDGRNHGEEFRPKVWEMLENGGTPNDACLGLGLFGAKQL